MSLCVGGDAFTVPDSENSAVGVTGSETLPSQHCDILGPSCSLCLPRRTSVRAEVGQVPPLLSGVCSFAAQKCPGTGHRKGDPGPHAPYSSFRGGEWPCPLILTAWLVSALPSVLQRL